jgi:uncharacterized membrane protein
MKKLLLLTTPVFGAKQMSAHYQNEGVGMRIGKAILGNHFKLKINKTNSLVIRDTLKEEVEKKRLGIKAKRLGLFSLLLTGFILLTPFIIVGNSSNLIIAILVLLLINLIVTLATLMTVSLVGTRNSKDASLGAVMAFLNLLFIIILTKLVFTVFKA